MRRSAVLLSLVAALLLAQDTKYPPQGQQFPGSPTKADINEWRSEMDHYRLERRIRAGLDGKIYQRPELKWAQSSFIQPQAMVEDRYLYDPITRRYTVDRYLDDVDKRYGGIDSILLWPVYPNIGIDNRNQFDLLRDMPGGIPALRQMVADFHRRGVRVLFPTMPWDTGTRWETSMPEAIAALMKEIGADGINGDTFGGIPRTYWTASEAIGHPLVLEPEGYPDSDEMLDWNVMSWGYWKYPFVPMVSRAKWLEPQHMVNVCNRWAKDKTDDLQAAFFNGVGYETWENIWGIWNGITERDAEAIRRIAKIERRFAPLLESSLWQPHYPTIPYGVFASEFQTGNSALFTFVNRTAYDIDGPQCPQPLRSDSPPFHFFDLWHGVELQPPTNILSFAIEANGFGAILAQTAPADASLNAFLAEMRALNVKPLSSFPKVWHFLPQHIVPIEPTAPATTAPEGMIHIPAMADFQFEVNGIEIEGGDDVGVDVQYPGEDSPRRHHVLTLNVPAFYIDKYPVTNHEFKAFVDAAHYHPSDDHNFLKDWKDDNRPVTWVSLEDARAYAKWAGKRLPHEWEWQYAAQGRYRSGDYPWGNQWCDECAPRHDNGHVGAYRPDPVDARPKGASHFGVMDLTGNIWQWTDEFQDEHTRAAILRGGSAYRPSGSRWYFPSAYKLTEHGKYLLIAPSKDRSGTVGFRCVRDAS
jgi:formylglycine-generating enzyme required for sulfatase activity